MAIDGFLVYPDIPGESQRRGHEDEIEIHDLTFAMASPQSSGGTVRRGRVLLRPIAVRKHYDRSSPYLKRALHQNAAAQEVTITLVRTVDGSTDDYLVVVLVDASVLGYDMSSTEDGFLEETLTLGYRSIRFTYDGNHEVELETQVMDARR